jgi:NAD-dependent SIR2 family protein deacetylase
MASEKNAISHCERCGWQYPLAKLTYENQPNKEPLRVCRSCYDPWNTRDDPDAFDVEEDTSLEDPVFDENFSSMWAWAPVGNVPVMTITTRYVWR